MNQLVLKTVILCLCHSIPITNWDAKMACIEKYVNCAVRSNGVILTEDQFTKQCDFQGNEKHCIEASGE